MTDTALLALRETRAALGQLVEQVEQMRGMFSDSDGAIRNALADAEAALAMMPPTPAAKWLERGEPDPHGDRYNCERAALAKGELTDDELANGIFMADRYSLDLIVWQTAAKDRIRWLSRALTAALTPQPAAEDYHLSEITGCLAEYRDMPTKDLGLRLYQAVDRAMFAAVQKKNGGGA
jgi:hypothetical protein